ncbi:MAG: RluA family pseudouridine synthase [Treponema sp.]|nr:RluA family pseudouridine synthase [Treponema sp.]
MFPPFEKSAARKICLEMLRELEQKKSLCGNQEFYRFKGMFGALVCLDEKGTQIVLRAFSGALAGKWNVAGFVPPLFDEEKYNAAISINDKKIHELSVAPEGETFEQKSARKKTRIKLCNETLRRIYALYNFFCADGIARNFSDIVKEKMYASFRQSENSETNKTREKAERDEKQSFFIPTGTGDCCAPKLLSYAFEKKLTPISLEEFFWNGDDTQKNCEAQFENPCDEKCGIILPAILGLKIIYRDENILVVEKPSGLLSVPGRGAEKQDCVVRRMQQLFPKTLAQPSVHRLDMDTSGLMVLAFDSQSHKNLSEQFALGKVRKNYIAVLDGIPQNETLGITRATKNGRLEIRHRVDIENRPHQIQDEIYGKLAVTLWKRERIWNMRGAHGSNGRAVTTVCFEPLTGRTHQLRFAAASPLGLNAPIVGDNLYGTEVQGGRLLLHASYLNFAHPATGEQMEFFSKPEFEY